MKRQLVSCQGSQPLCSEEAGIAMFTVEQRDALRDRVLRLAEEDGRVVAAAVVGSLAVEGGGDRFSDLDVTFGIADRVPVTRVLDDWTTRLVDELDAVTLADLERGPTDTRAVARDIFGWGVIYALHTRACIERRRVWQAEHYVGAVRDHALSLACLRHGVVAVQARGYDELPAEIPAEFTRTLVGAAEPGTLRIALAAAVTALLREGAQVPVPSAGAVAERLAALC
jgi:predicted nucleotidyltransferase